MFADFWPLANEGVRQLLAHIHLFIQQTMSVRSVSGTRNTAVDKTHSWLSQRKADNEQKGQ